MLGEILVKIGADVDDLTKGLQHAQKSLRNFGGDVSSMGSQITATFGAASAGIAAGLGVAVSTAADFDTSMRKAGAVAGASATELDAMRQAALDLGASTSQSASGVAGAMQEMAAKGYDATQIIASMPAVISAAEASGEDLALAADTVSSAMNSFGLEAGEAGKVADVLASVANSTAAGIGDMSYALKYAGTPAATLGISLEETAAAIGLMTNAGLDGSSAGTALRASLFALLNPSKENEKAMAAMGFSITDSEGKMKSISEIIADMTAATEGMTDAQKTATIASLVGTEASSGFLTLMKEGAPAIDELTASLENSAGSSAKTAEQMKAGIGGAIEGMKGAIETFAIVVGDQLVPYVTQAANFVANLANSFNNASPAVQKFITFGAVLAAALAGIVAIGGGLVFVIGGIISAFGAITGAIGTVTALFASGGAAAGVLGSALTALTGPVGIVIAAIVGLGAVFVTAYKNVEWFRDMVNKAWSVVRDAAVAAFGALKSAVTDAIGGIVSFGKSQLSVFTGIWETHGSTIVGAMKLYLQAISVVFTAVFGTLKTTVTAAWSVIKLATTAAWALIKTTISTSLNLVAGVINVVMSALKGDWAGAWGHIKKTASTIMSNIISNFKGINLLSVGKQIIQGLINGIGSMAGAVKKKIQDLAGNVTTWAKDVLGIHSPSRVFRDQVGKWIPIGMAVGIEKNLGVLRSAAQEMAAASLPDFKTQLAITEKDRKTVQTLIAGAVRKDAGEIKKVTAKAATDRRAIEKDAAADILKINNDTAAKIKALTKKSKTTAAQIRAAASAKITKIEKSKAAALVKIDTKLQKDIDKISKTTNGDKMKTLNEYVDAQKASNNMSLKQEVEFWKYSATAFKKGSKEKTEALEKYNKAHAELSKQQFDDEKAYIEMRKNFNAISMKEEVVAYNKYMKGYEQGTDEWLHYYQKAADTREAISDQITSTNENFVERAKKINDDLIANEAAANDHYASTLESRYSTIKGYYGLFDEVEKTKPEDQVQGDTLKKNLEDQIASLTDWQFQLQSLNNRGISMGLLDELRGMGVDAAAELGALSKMTDVELAEYDTLFSEKMALAKAAAVRELEPLREETAAKIGAMRDAAKQEIGKLETEWTTQLEQIVNGTGTTFTKLSDVGAFAVQGLRDGMLSMTGELSTAAKTLAETIEKTIRNTLQVKSPSRVLKAIGLFAGEGLELGLIDTEQDVERAAATLAKAATPNIDPINFSGYTSDATGKIETQLQTQFEADTAAAKGDFILQVDGYELARTQKSHIGSMMKRDTSLRTKVRGL